MIASLQTAISDVPNRKARLQGLTQVENVRLKVERAALLFRGAPIAIIASILNAVITLLAAWSKIPHNLLLLWGGVILGLGVIRIAVWLRFRIGGVSGRNMSRFARVHIIFMALNGALWGALAPLFAVHGMLSHAFLPFVIAGTAAASVVSAGASWRAVIAFNVPALMPLAVVYTLMGDNDGAAIGGVVVLFGFVTAYLAFVTQRMIDRSILLHSKNEKLFSALQRQVNESHESEQRYRALVEASLDITLIFSPDGKITYASSSVETVFGVPSDAMIGRTSKDIVHPDDLPQFRSVGEKSLSTIGEAVALSHVCMRARDGDDWTELAGRLTNMMYVPGVEGFVFSGGKLLNAGHPSANHTKVHDAETGVLEKN